ncbi:hypothetical protein [Streptomyces cucumeris]|uniref:hypothetical protein n=1 Tax=Streptomyces cucumeris TaxID=2962890 RepID=UPI003D76163C
MTRRPLGTGPADVDTPTPGPRARTAAERTADAASAEQPPEPSDRPQNGARRALGEGVSPRDDDA